MEEEAECKLNLDQEYQEEKYDGQRYKNTPFEIIARKTFNYCNPYQLCQGWKQWSGKDAFCVDSHQCDWQTSSYPNCKNLVENNKFN